MIDFRYHIVSITAVFLALGIGVAVGATVLDQVSVDALRNQLNELSSDLDARRAEITTLRGDVRRTDSIVKDLAPRVMEGRLVGRTVLFVDGAGGARWAGTARRAILDAGAEDAGSLSFTPRWDVSGAGEALGELWRQAGIEPPEGAGAEELAGMLGELVLTLPGRPLQAALEEAGYVRTDLRGDDAWPPPATDVVIFTTGTEDDGTQARWMAALASGIAATTPTSVSAGSTEDPGAVATLRRQRGLPSRLATFDSAEMDETGLGSVLAFEAAIEGRGGHYGTASGLSYIPPA